VHIEPLSRGQGRVHLLVDETPGKEKAEPKVIDVGITDGVNTQVLAGLNEGQEIQLPQTQVSANPSGGGGGNGGGGRGGG